LRNKLNKITSYATARYQSAIVASCIGDARRQ